MQSTSGKSALTKHSLATFDRFAADNRDMPRKKTLAGKQLVQLIGELERQEPWLTTTSSIKTSADRLDGTAINIMKPFYESIDRLHLIYNILDQEPTRTMNFDEAGLNNRGEYEKQDLQVFVSKGLLKLLKGRTPVRSLCLNDGSGNVTMIPFILGGGIHMATAFIGPVSAAQVQPDWSAPEKWTEPATAGMPYLPGMRHDHFKTNKTRVFATESGSNNKDLLEYMLIQWIIPEWRKMHPTGPLVILQDAPHAHGWTQKLCKYCAENEIIIIKFPHNSTTMTQCLDVYFFKCFRKIYRTALENLRAAWEYSCAFLDYTFVCRFQEAHD